MTLFLTVFGLFENHKVMVTFFFDSFGLFENTNVMMPCFLLFFGLFENTKLWWRFSRLFGVFLEILHAMMTLFLFRCCRYRFSACYGDIFAGLSQAAIFLGKN